MKYLLKDVPDWAKVKPQDTVVWAGFPRQYRIDAANGAFFSGSENLGNALQVIPFDFRWSPIEERWGFPRQSWFDLAFVDVNNCASVLSLKKDSAVNLFCHLLGNQASGIANESMQISIRLFSRQRDGETVYYVASVDDVRFLNEEQFKRVQEFSESGVFEFGLAGEM